MGTDAEKAAAPSHAAFDTRKRWLAIIVLCLGVLMIVIDVTVVSVALPSIREDLKFTENSFVWVVNSYMLTYGGSLLLGGRLGDLYGQRRLFLIGISLFTLASLACGLANTQSLLVAARAVQGLGGAIVVAVALSLIMDMCPDAAERTKAMGVYGFVCAAGGSVGLLLGGTLTSALDWHWIFLVNLPVGVAVYALCLRLVPHIQTGRAEGRIDVWGAVTVTMSLMFAIYAIVNANEAGWTSVETVRLLACAAALLAIFIVIEARVPTPLMPLWTFRLRNLTMSSILSVLWAAGGWTWLFISAQYMQLVLGYGPMQVGLAFLPANIITAAFSLGVSARLVTRFGVTKPLAFGLLLSAIGLASFARAPVNGAMMTDVLPGMILLGLGGGIAYSPLLLAAMRDVSPGESGLASGIVNTACIMGGALGLAIIASLSAARTRDLLASGATAPVALTCGYHVAFLVGAICIGTAGLLGTAFLRTRQQAPASEHASIGAALPVRAKD